MCPMCWATALAAFALLFAVSVLVVAGTDRPTLSLATLLVTTGALHRWTELVRFPWWTFVALIACAVVRVGYLVALKRRRLLFVQVWERARCVAAKRCPTKTVQQDQPKAEVIP